MRKCNYFFKEFTYDPDTYKEESQCRKYICNELNVDAYYRENILQGKLHFAVLLDDAVIGDTYLKHIDQKRKCRSFGIHLINDAVKNMGYGTKAVKRLLQYAFNELNMESVFADCLIKNKRSQRVLMKVGFVEINRDEEYIYYECCLQAWIQQNNRTSIQNDPIRQ